MARKRIAVVGAGSLRCSPPVLSSITAPRFERPLEVCLYDANAERLDLMVRLAQRLVEVTRTEHEVVSCETLGDAMRDAGGVIVTLYEDSARRMTGKTSARVLLPSEPVDGGKLTELHRGDLNKPTEFDELKPMTLAALSTPAEADRTREDVISAAVSLVTEKLNEAPVLNLTRGAAFPNEGRFTSVEWPEPLSADQHASFPHRLLRWINGDPELDEYLERYEDSPVAKWLTEELGAL